MGTAVSQSQFRVGGIFVSGEDIVVTGSDGKDKSFPLTKPDSANPSIPASPPVVTFELFIVVVPSYVFSALNPRGRG